MAPWASWCIAVRIGVLFSGGKDSNLALYRLLRGGHDVAVLISAIPKRGDSWMFHVPNVEHAGLQAASMGYPWERVEVSGVADAEMDEFEQAMRGLSKKWGLDALGTGAIASRYQRDRIEGMCSRLDLECVSPLWAQDEEALLRETLALGFDVMFTSVSAEGLTKDWLGSRLDDDRISSLLRLKSKNMINISGEGGEYETFVCDSPLFRKRINILSASLDWRHNSGTLTIDRAELVGKRLRQ